MFGSALRQGTESKQPRIMKWLAEQKLIESAAVMTAIAVSEVKFQSDLMFAEDAQLLVPN
jgi:hypothetical protein